MTEYGIILMQALGLMVAAAGVAAIVELAINRRRSKGATLGKGLTLRSNFFGRNITTPVSSARHAQMVVNGLTAEQAERSAVLDAKGLVAYIVVGGIITEHPSRGK